MSLPIPARQGASLVLILALLVAPSAFAAPVVVCVHNNAELKAAAEQATTTSTTIKLVQGTYQIDGSYFDAQYYFNCGGYCKSMAGGLQLLGGYTTGCASRHIDPNNTEIRQEPYIGSFYITARGDVTIEGLKFSLMPDPITINWNDHDGVANNVNAVIRRVIVDGGSLYNGLDMFWDVKNADQKLTARLVDDLLVGIVPEDGYCAAEFDTYSNSDATFVLINNSIVGNDYGGGGNGVCLGAGINDGGTLMAYNNIFYGNAGYDLITYSGTHATLVDNVIGTHSYQGTVSHSGTLTGNPKLDSSYRPIESPPSPVINSGTNDVPGGLPTYDLAGGPRVIGNTVDRGAYESGISDSFLQTVTNNHDSGAGSLRAAIIGANGNGATGALITFDIGTDCGPHVITLASPLPDIVAPVLINGFTQPGASPNDLDVGNDAQICIVLEAGTAQGAPDHAFDTTSSAPAATQLTVEGLAFSGFTGTAIDLQGGSGHGISGNHFGGAVSGYSLSPNNIDIRLGIGTHDVIIGGNDVANRNLIGSALSSSLSDNAGIVLQGSASGQLLLGTYNDQIVNNYIGVGWSQNNSIYTNRGANVAILLAGHDNVISDNLIGNSYYGIHIEDGGATGNLVENNFIGADADGKAFGNFWGIIVDGSAGDAPHDNIVRNNVVANTSPNAGIFVAIGQGNKIRKNSIYSNSGLGIALVGSGVLANDDDGALQTADYANHGLNFPVLGTAIGSFNQGTVSGSLTTLPGTYTIDLYLNDACNNSGHGEGRVWLKGLSVTVPTPSIGDQGHVNFSTAIGYPILNGSTITATTTDAGGDTSEFSACVDYINDTIFTNGFEPLIL